MIQALRHDTSTDRRVEIGIHQLDLPGESSYVNGLLSPRKPIRVKCAGPSGPTHATLAARALPNHTTAESLKQLTDSISQVLSFHVFFVGMHLKFDVYSQINATYKLVFDTDVDAVTLAPIQSYMGDHASLPFGRRFFEEREARLPDEIPHWNDLPPDAQVCVYVSNAHSISLI